MDKMVQFDDTERLYICRAVERVTGWECWDDMEDVDYETEIEPVLVKIIKKLTAED